MGQCNRIWNTFKVVIIIRRIIAKENVSFAVKKRSEIILGKELKTLRYYLKIIRRRNYEETVRVK